MGVPVYNLCVEAGDLIICTSVDKGGEEFYKVGDICVVVSAQKGHLYSMENTSIDRQFTNLGGIWGEWDYYKRAQISMKTYEEMI
jgi:hypothetical protein